MTTYAKVSAARLVEYVVDSPYPQPGLEEISFVVGTPPGRGYRLNIDTRLWVDTRTEQQKYDQSAGGVRVQRNKLLADSDWTDTASAPARLGEPLYTQWQIYRQALRDVTTQPGYPFDVVWPTPPQ